MLSSQKPQQDKSYYDPLNYTGTAEAAPKRSIFTMFLSGWYWLTAPPEVGQNADLQDREAVRRGRLASIILVFALFNTTVALPGAIGNKNNLLLTILIVFLLLELFAFFLNRRKHITLAGLICVVGLECGLIGSVLSYRQLSADTLQLLDLLIMPLIYAASLLPSGSVFIVALINCACSVVIFNLMPHSAEINGMLDQQRYALLFRVLTMQAVVAIVTHMWVRSAVKAIVRADRSDAIASLERTLARKDHAEAEQKQVLEAGINDIVQAIAKIAQDPTAPVAVNTDKPLWQILAALNNLRKRLIRVGQEAEGYAHEVEQTRRALATLCHYLSQGPERLASTWQPTNTAVDEIAWQLVNSISRQRSAQPGVKRDTFSG